MARLTKYEVRNQNRLHEQLDFFGAKKRRFVSIYAKKPHIRLKVKGDPISRGSANSHWLVEIARQQQALFAQGLGASAFASQQSQLAAMGASGLANSGFGHAGGLGFGQGVAGLGMLGLYVECN